MPAFTAATHSIIESFCQASLRTLIRAELQDRVPARFTGVGQEIWKTFQNELTVADLLILAIQDAAANMPVPFDPQYWLPITGETVPAWSELQVSAEAVHEWLEDAHQKAKLPLDDFLKQQAELLRISLPNTSDLGKLPTPPKHEHWLELPDTGGWVAFTLCSRAEHELYLWENFTILCNSPQEMIFAGLIAWELGAPPNQDLPILMDDVNLSRIMDLDKAFHNVVGKRAKHGHRDLRFLHHDNMHPLWL